MGTALYFFGGLADIFLSIMLWFILDSQRSSVVLVDRNKVYAVVDVIKPGNSEINKDCSTEDEYDQGDADAVRQCSYSLTPVSRIMIEQFFTEVEGPDRDWSD